MKNRSFSSLLLHQAGFSTACRYRQGTTVASNELKTPIDFSRLGSELPSIVSAALSLSLRLRKKTVAVSNCHDAPEGVGVRTFLWGKLLFPSDYLVCKICV